jgi:hypothetical protein
MKLVTAVVMLMSLMLGCPAVGHAGDVNVELALPRIGGWVMLSDGVTLIVALPDDLKLAYIDTVAGKELKRVKLPFKPDRLAAQGKRLFASVEGASVVHVLDLDSGADKKSITVPSLVEDMVCHAKTGPVFTTTSQGIVAINPTTGAAILTGDLATMRTDLVSGRTLCKAGGSILAIDPSNASTLYTGGVYGSGRRCNMGSGFNFGKYAVGGKAEYNPNTANYTFDLLPVGPFWPLRTMAANKNALGGVDYGTLCISGDGKKVGTLTYMGAQAGSNLSGGVRIVLFTADDIKSQAGAIACNGASDLAFHPVLNLMAAAALDPKPGGRTTLHLFNSDSLAETGKFDISPPLAEPVGKPACRLLTFGDRGTKVLYYDWKTGNLRSLPLTLTDKDKKLLGRAYPVRNAIK